MEYKLAIINHASFLILDEPTNGLDVLAREEIIDLIREFMEEDENRSVLISSHISSDLEGLKEIDIVYIFVESNLNQNLYRCYLKDSLNLSI